MLYVNLSKYFWLLPVLFVAEIYISWYFASIIGFWWSIAWIFGTMMLGTALLKRTHIAIAASMQSLFVSGGNLNTLYRQNISYIMGAILLIIPGIISDAFGILLLVYAFYLQTIGTIPHKTNYEQNKGNDDVIDAEIINNNAIDYDRNGHNSL
ncbi:MAG: FxsA family protein [Sulfurovaceae bacterium]|nr:FxsA family protein [Sulfurovaceae bacterium]